MLGAVHRKTSCLTHQRCIPNLFTLPESVEVGTFEARQRHIRGHDDLQGTYFGLSRYYDPANGPPLDMPVRGGDKSAPEHQDNETPYNPFPTDVYYLGNLVRKHFMQVCVCICD